MRGDVVVIPFPFSNLRGFKRRPALVLADWGSDDLVLCQITSKNVRDTFALSLGSNDIICGKIPIIGNIRPNKLFTAEKSIILYKIGALKGEKLKNVLDKLSNLFGL